MKRQSRKTLEKIVDEIIMESDDYLDGKEELIIVINDILKRKGDEGVVDSFKVKEAVMALKEGLAAANLGK